MAIAMKGDRLMLEYIKNRVTDFDVGYFVNELANASKIWGILEAKIDSYQFNSILIPMLQKKKLFLRCISKDSNDHN